MKLTLTQFVTLDGVSQGPGSASEDPTDGFTRGGWLVPYLDETFVARASAWLDRAEALLFGRRTYEAFARDWPRIAEPDRFTVRMNTLPRYVVSRTLSRADWGAATVLADDPVAEVRALRAAPGGELQLHGSARLANTLLGAGLVDVLRLAVVPTVLGQGRRLLTHPGAATGWQVVEHDRTPSGLLLLEAEAVGAARFAEFAGTTGLAS